MTRPRCPRAPARRPRARSWAGPRAPRHASRESRNLAPIRFALLEEGVLSRLRLLGGVVEKRGVARELLQSRQSVGIGVERRLEEAQRRRALLEDLARPLHRLGVELLQRHHGVDEPHLQRLGCVVLATEIPDLARLLVADAAREVAGAVAGVEAADDRAGLAEARVVR